jgi:hypothetical protein
MWKIIKQKFKSKPKKISFIKYKFISKNRFCYKKTAQLKLSDVKPYTSLNIFRACPSQEIFNLNIYLDWKTINQYNRKKRMDHKLISKEKQFGSNAKKM